MKLLVLSLLLSYHHQVQTTTYIKRASNEDASTSA